MSTLAIPPRRVRQYRLLWDRWVIVLRILFDLGAGTHPVKWRDVADTLLIDKKTSQKYISGLIRDGHLAKAGDGYMLTENGMGFLADDLGGGEILPAEGKNPGDKFPLKKLEEEVNEFNLTTTSSSKMGKNPGEIFSPEVKQALEQLPLLFDGSEITLRGLPVFLHIEKVLGWIAFAYDRRQTLTAPCGLIYSKLRDEAGPAPSIKYMKDPCQFLPEDYLDAIGRYAQTCNRCQGEFTSKAEYDTHRETCLHTFQPDLEQDEDMVEAADATVTAEVQTMWNETKTRLQADLPRAHFDTWVFDTFPVHYAGDALQVATRNSFARDWLSRPALVAKASTALAQVAGRAMHVSFVVAMETVEE